MMYDSVINKLEEMKSRYNDGFSSSDRKFINEVHIIVFGKRVVNTSCSDCWRDAYILSYNKLKKMGQMPKEKEYIIRNGCILSVFGTNVIRVGSTVTTEEAEQYLKRYPHQIKIFSRYPTNWKERVAKVELKELSVASPDVENDKQRIAELEMQVGVLKEQLEASAAKANEYQQTISELRSHIAKQGTRKRTKK